MFGLLNLHKPAGETSRDTVNRVQRLVRPLKVGHAGTLDPLATGVLVLCLGPATRLIDYVQRMRKRYVATFQLGRESDTEDREGRIVELVDPPRPTAAELTAKLPAFTGEISQRPPAFSALKVGGKRAYELARRGDAVELAERPVTIHSLRLVRFAYPEFQLEIECGSGTYVRSLGRDLARSLGTGAIMTELERTAIGPFRVAEAVRVEQLDHNALSRFLLSPLLAVAELPRVTLSDDELKRVAHGGWLIPAALGELAPSQAELAAVNATGELRAVLERRPEQSWKPKVNFEP